MSEVIAMVHWRIQALGGGGQVIERIGKAVGAGFKIPLYIISLHPFLCSVELSPELLTTSLLPLSQGLGKSPLLVAVRYHVVVSS